MQAHACRAVNNLAAPAEGHLRCVRNVGVICRALVLPRVPALVNSVRSAAKSIKALLPIYTCPLQWRAHRKNARLQRAACGKIPHGCTTVTREGPTGLITAQLVRLGKRSGQGRWAMLSQTNARAVRNPHSLIGSLYFYYNLQNCRWYFTFIWESLCSLQTFTQPIWGEFFHAHFTDMECGWTNITVKTSAARFPCLHHHILPSLPKLGLPGGAAFQRNC